MKKLLYAYILFVSSLCQADGLKQFELNTLNPVMIQSVNDATSIDICRNTVIVIPDSNNDHSLPYVMYCGKGNVPYDKNTLVAELAASELSHFIEKSTGVNIPVITESTPIPAGKIPMFVGMSEAAGADGFDISSIRPEGFRVMNNVKAIAILGALPGGMSEVDGAASTLFGVYDFLERFVGVRFYYPDEGIIVPRRKSIVVPALSYEDYPRFDHPLAYSWTHPAPKHWRGESYLRFNLIRQRMHKTQDGRILKEKSRWNLNLISSPFDLKGFGKVSIVTEDGAK